MEASLKLIGNILTTDFVLLEVADGLATRFHRKRVIALLDDLEGSEEIIVPVSKTLLQEAWDLYRAREDKDWSLTDCTSFVVMRKNGVTDALTGDVHFRQAGFNPLLAGTA